MSCQSRAPDHSNPKIGHCYSNRCYRSSTNACFVKRLAITENGMRTALPYGSQTGRGNFLGRYPGFRVFVRHLGFRQDALGRRLRCQRAHPMLDSFALADGGCSGVWERGNCPWGFPRCSRGRKADYLQLGLGRNVFGTGQNPRLTGPCDAPTTESPLR